MGANSCLHTKLMHIHLWDEDTDSPPTQRPLRPGRRQTRPDLQGWEQEVVWAGRGRAGTPLTIPVTSSGSPERLSAKLTTGPAHGPQIFLWP